jgi:Lrp/AsnC family transcriptional regulator for asnA, asnC and gidA
MDQLDYQIMIELQENSRRSNRQIARVIGVSETTVRRRINNLIRAKTIKLAAIPDPVKLGYPTYAFFHLQVDFSEINSAAEALANYPEVLLVSSCSGTRQLIVSAIFRSPSELSDFITEELGKIQGIIRIETIMHLKFIKRTLGWVQRDSNI